MARLEQDFYYILFGGQKIFWGCNLLLKFWIEILSLAIGSLEVRMLSLQEILNADIKILTNLYK